MSIHDKEFNIVKVNRAFEEFFEVKSEQCVGKKCWEIVHGSKKMHSNCPCKVVKSSKKQANANFFEKHLKKHIEVSAFPILNSNEDMSGSVHIIKLINK